MFLCKGYTKVLQGLYPSIGWREAGCELKFKVMHIPWCFCFKEFFFVWFLLQQNTDSFPTHALIKSKCNSSLESQQHCLTTVQYLSVSHSLLHTYTVYICTLRYLKVKSFFFKGLICSLAYAHSPPPPVCLFHDRLWLLML